MHHIQKIDRERAERKLKARELQKADAPKAVEEYYAAQQALRDRTQELRRMRLSHEAQALTARR